MLSIGALWHDDGRPLETASAAGPEVAWGDGGIRLTAEADEGLSESAEPAGAPRLIAAADARLDNRAELLAQLFADEGAAAAGRGDADLVIAAYRAWGEACPARLEGDFAFVVWDAARRRVFCARDAMGVRALYYHRRPGMFCCASTIRRLRELGSVGRRLSETRIADFLAMTFLDQAATFDESIARLPPGHSLTLQAGAPPRLTCYWSLDPERRAAPADDTTYAAQFRERLEAAVRGRLRTTRRLGFLFSGGLDSTSVVGLARRQPGSNAAGDWALLAATFAGQPVADEESFIDLGAAELGLPCHHVPVETLSPLRAAAEIYADLDEPFHAPNLHIYVALARQARALGFGALLDGVDGDTVVGHGQEWLVELLAAGRWGRLWRESHALARRLGQPTRRLLWHFALQPALRRILPGAGRAPRVPSLIRPELARRIDYAARLRALHAGRLRPARTLREEHWRQLTCGIIGFYLEVNDRMARAIGVGHAHPFYDRRLVEFCLALPPEQRLSDGWDRAVERRAMAGLIPEPIARRMSKAHWGRHFERQMLTADRAMLEAMALRPPEALAEFVDTAVLRASFERAIAGRPAESDITNLWVAATLGLWLAGAP